jgi:hypothetical protein
VLTFTIDLEWHWIALGDDLETALASIIKVRKVLLGTFEGLQLSDTTKRNMYIDEVKNTLKEVMKKSHHWKEI